MWKYKCQTKERLSLNAMSQVLDLGGDPMQYIGLVPIDPQISFKFWSS